MANPIQPGGLDAKPVSPVKPDKSIASVVPVDLLDHAEEMDRALGPGAASREAMREVLMANPLGSKEFRRGDADFTPTDRDLAMYLDYSAGYNSAAICRKYKVEPRTMNRRMRYVSDWVRDELIGDIQSLRAQQTMLLMRHYRELKRLWDYNQFVPEEDLRETVENAVKAVMDEAAQKQAAEAEATAGTAAATAEGTKPKRKYRKKGDPPPPQRPLNGQYVAERVIRFMRKKIPVRVDNPLPIMTQMLDVLDAVAKINGMHKLRIEHSEADPDEGRVAGMTRSQAILAQIEKMKRDYQEEIALEAGSPIVGDDGRYGDSDDGDGTGDDSHD